MNVHKEFFKIKKKEIYIYIWIIMLNEKIQSKKFI